MCFSVWNKLSIWWMDGLTDWMIEQKIPSRIIIDEYESAEQVRPCWNDQKPFGMNFEKTRPSEGLWDLNTCHWTLNLKPATGIFWVSVIDDQRLFLLNVGSWTLKEIFSWHACRHLFQNNVHWSTMHDSAFFSFFVIYYDLVLSCFSFTLFFFSYWGGCDMMRDLLLRHWFPVCVVALL